MNSSALQAAQPASLEQPMEITARQAPEGADVAWFKAALGPNTGHTAQAVPDNVAARIIGQLSQRSDALQRLSDRAGRDLQKAARTATPEDMLKANRSLSSFYLESVMTAKLVAKGSQAVEKLTNLQ
ncbi:MULTISPECIES: type III secretion system inner rod subunit SctI [unclassified Pseudomonas]|uniref:type III secretion system inner rod subunit SctI n=2 Tax=unclassified Pseudomonas TaxID=196821 RepID=UPI00235F6EB1|nr:MULTISPECIES: type III secretion system inner rod subunit SctI [unclassified Pseudomonas]